MGLKDEIKKAVNWDAPSVDIEDSLRAVIRKMAQSKSSALLVKLNDVVIGVVTDMDLMRSVVEKKNLDTTMVSEFMTGCELITEKPAKNPCVQLHQGETVENALGILDVSGLHNLVVSGEDDKCSGIVTVRDLLELAES